MQPRIFESAECYICGEVYKGKFRNPVFFCNRHRQDEIDFHQSLPDKRLTKDQKAQRLLYARRWKGKDAAA